MSISDLYIPNVDKWLQYYKNRGPGRISEHQKGGSFVRGGGKETVVPIEKTTKVKQHNQEINEIPVKIVSPAQATVDQAKSEIARAQSTKSSLKRNRQGRKSSRHYKRRRANKKKSTGKKSGTHRKRNKKSSKTRRTGNKKKSKKTPRKIDIFAI
jgi:hypothetical protein